MDDKERAELEFISAQARRCIIETQKMVNEDLLTHKKLRWYEIVIVGGLGLSAGISIAQLLLR